MRGTAPKIALFAVSLALSLCAAEFGARRVEKAWGYRYYNRTLAMGRGPDRSLRPSLRLGYEPVPGRAGHDSRGFMNPEYPSAKGPDVFRVMLAGDSLAEKYGRHLLAALEQDPPPGKRVELWNLGVPGYNLPQAAARLLEQGLDYDPDLVVLFHCLNDLVGDVPVLVDTEKGFMNVDWAGKADMLRLPAAELLWHRSALYRLAMLTHLRRLQRAGSITGSTSDRRQLASERLDAVKEACARRRVPVVSVIFPYLMPASEYRTEDEEYRRILVDLLREKGIPCHDLHGLFPEASLRGLREDPRDHIHMSDAAAAATMQRVRALLRDDLPR